MKLNLLKEEKIFWTKHSKMKMQQYNLSERRVLRILRKPERKEIGMAPGTIAVMQIAGTKKHPSEIWVMYQIDKIKNKKSKIKKLKIISAWRYPGISPRGEPLPIPDDVLQDLVKEDIIK